MLTSLKLHLDDIRFLLIDFELHRTHVHTYVYSPVHCIESSKIVVYINLHLSDDEDNNRILRHSFTYVILETVMERRSYTHHCLGALHFLHFLHFLLGT